MRFANLSFSTFQNNHSIENLMIVCFASQQVNGLSLLLVSGTTPYAFALNVLDILFTKAELAGSLLEASRRSTRKALDKTKVQLLYRKSSCSILCDDSNRCPVVLEYY